MSPEERGVPDMMPNLVVAAVSRRAGVTSDQRDGSIVVFGYQVNGVWNRPLTQAERDFAVALLRYTSETIALQDPATPSGKNQVTVEADERHAFEEVRIARLALKRAQEHQALAQESKRKAEARARLDKALGGRPL